MKYLGIDYGTRRIGVAVSDEAGSLAFPLVTVEAGREALSKVAELAGQNNAEKIVIGESRNFKNEPNLVQEDIEQFKKDLEELAGVQAARQFAPDGSRKENPSQEKLDAAAAALILQSYLDRIK